MHRVTLITFLSLSIVFDRPAAAESLADAIAFAYRTNPTLQSGRYDVRSADEDIVQARSELRPAASLQVTGEYDRTVEGRSESRANPFSPEAFNSNSNQASVVVNQPLYTGGRASADLRIAEAGVRAARETLRGTEGDLLLDVITSYVDVRRYQKELEVWRKSVAELQLLADEVEARRVAGELTKTDLAQAESQLEAAREQVVSTEESLEAARADYTNAVGRNPGLLDEEPPLPQLPANVDDAYFMAEKISPELASARYTELSSREGIVSARAAGRPNISLRGSAALNGEAVPYHLRDQDQGFSGSVVLSLPLSSGGQTASLIRQAEDKNSSDRLKIEVARRQLVRGVTNAWNDIVSDQRLSERLAVQRGHAQIQLDGMTSEYRLGLRSTFDVLYAEQSLRDVEVSLLSAQRDKYVAQATLLRALGLLEANTLTTGVERYDPAAHLRHVEHKNATPLDGFVQTIDRMGAPHPHQPTIEQSANGDPAAQIVAARSDGSAQQELSRSEPLAPLDGTTGRSSAHPDWKDR